MEYTNGYVAFVDILGFSNLVTKDNDVSKVKDLFEFVEKFQNFFNTSPELHTKVAFFSDSIVFTTDSSNLEMLLLAIRISESYLYNHLGRYFRGAITKGKYYHEGRIAFGPAIVRAHDLENEAIYSRILIDDCVISDFPEDFSKLTIMKDFDGKYCYNPFGIGLLTDKPDGSSSAKERMIKSLSEERKQLSEAIANNMFSKVADKYLWRIGPFNKMCDMIPEICDEMKLSFCDEDFQECQKMKIRIEEFLQ